MRLGSGLKWVVVLGALAYLTSPAAAQNGAAPPAPAPDAEGNLARKTQLSPQEMLQEAQRRVTRMEGSAGTVAKKLATAREKKDVVKTLCLNDKLSQMNMANRTAAERLQSLKNAVNRNDVESANHDFTVLQTVAQRHEQLGSDANQCAGSEAAFVGDTAVTTTIDPNVAPGTGVQPGGELPGTTPNFPPPPPLPATPIQ